AGDINQSSRYMARSCSEAEDGIRDATVTGVQTCALPISGDLVGGLLHFLAEDDLDGPFGPHDGDLRGRPGEDAVGAEILGAHGRSEEGRVGKECRARWEREGGERITEKKK